MTKPGSATRLPRRQTLDPAFAADILAAFTYPETIRGSLQACAEAIVDHVGAAFARIWTLNEDEDVLELQASAGKYTHIDGAHSRVPVGQLKIGRIAADREPHLTNDVAHDDRISDPVWAAKEGMVAFAGYPLIAGDRLVGVVALFADHDLDARVLDMLEGLAGAVAVAVDRQREAVDCDRQRSLLAAVIDQMPTGLVVVDAEGGVLRTNREFDKLGADPLHTHQPVVPAAGQRPVNAEREWPLVKALRDGERVIAEEVECWLPDGSPVAVLASAGPVRDRYGRVVAGVMTVEDVTERRRTERRSAVQRAVSGVLTRAGSLAEAAGPVLAGVCEAIGWDIGVVWAVDGDELHCVRSWSVPSLPAPRFEEASRELVLSRGEGLPGRVWVEGGAVWVADMLEETGWTRRRDAAEPDQIRRGFGVPILHGSQVLGVLEFFGRAPGEPDEDLLATMTAIGRQVGLFVDRRASEAKLRISEARKTAMLEASLDCVVSMDSDGRITEFNPAAEQTFGYARDEAIGQLVGDLLVPVHLRDAHREGLARYLETGESTILDRRLELTAVRADGTEIPVELAVARVDIDGPAIFIGYLRDISSRRRVQQALVASRERFANVARTLQTSLLPPNLPEIEGIDLAAAFRPAGQGDEIGGDFYDVVSTGRNEWTLIVGDVCGKGPEAAALTALVRYTVRAAALRSRRPSHVLAIANEAVLREGTERFCTAVHARLRVGPGEAQLMISCAGHPLPFLVRGDGHVESMGRRGTALGITDNGYWRDVSFALAPGDTVVLYTDGVTEARAGADLFGEERLRDLLARSAGTDAGSLARRIESDVIDFQNGIPRDDIAIIVMRVPTAGPGER